MSNRLAEIEAEVKRQLGLRSEVTSIGPPYVVFKDIDLYYLIERVKKLEAVKEAAGKIGCHKMGGSCMIVGFKDLEKAWKDAE